MERLLCSIPEAAEALGVCRSRIYQSIRQKNLETVKIGRRHLVCVASVRALAMDEAATTGSNTPRAADERNANPEFILARRRLQPDREVAGKDAASCPFRK